MTQITSVAITEFEFPVHDIGLETAAAGVGNMAFVKGNTFTAKRFAIQITNSDGAVGEYVANWVATPSSLGQASMLAPLLLGRNPEHREKIYDDL